MRSLEDMSAQEAQEFFDAYTGSLPQLRERLRRRLDTTGGPAVGTSVEALRLLDPWYCEQIVDPAPDRQEGIPLWWDPTRKRSPHFNPTDNQLRLVDEVGAHVAAVIQQAVPAARWAIKKQPGGSRTYGHHKTVLEAPGMSVPPWVLAHSQLACLARSEPPQPGLLRSKVMKLLAKAREAEGG